jgi:chemotaxis regulatin CheY-phosphate phosphatase CheZ
MTDELTTPEGAGGRFITIPATARDEIGELTFYLGRVLLNLRQVNAHVRGSAQPMPGLLHDLREIVKMTEIATVKVLEETEALVEEARAAAALIADARGQAGDARVDAALGRLSDLVATANKRAMAIMTALEFQDLTAQKVERAFAVLEEVQARLGKIQALVDTGQPTESEPAPVAPPVITTMDGRAAQAVADRLCAGLGR